ncbi:MAG TPA: hypothetical protein PK825_04325 [Bacteroidales bacterium]|nr:hypothetical protein [Bacteroidales bacterium]
MKVFFVTLIMMGLAFSPQLAKAQKGSSIVIHDNTSQTNGGENATSNLRKEITSALNREKPCTDLMDDQDIRNVLESEREKNLLEGGDPQQVLTDIGNLMGASYVMSVSATPGAGGTNTYTVFVMDPQSGKTIARQTGTDAKQIADNITRQLGSSLSDDCKPHWVGEVRYDYSSNETKVTNDAGAMHASTRNTKRTKTETYIAQNSIVAMLLPPKPGSNITTSKAIARVWMRSKIISERKEETVGEIYCRLKGENPEWKGYNASYAETITQLGGGADNLPVSISLDDEGNYSIVVSSPGGVLIGKVETKRSESGCGPVNPPSIDAVSMPEQKLDKSGFDVTGKTDAKNRDSLTGSKTMPDGKTKITWHLKLVKPKKKN